MSTESRETLRNYYNAAASHYLDRASTGMMGWLRKRELSLSLEMIPKQGSTRALDAGCGPAYYSQVLRDRGFDVTAIDLSPEMVSKAKALGFPAFEMDIEHSQPAAEMNAPFDFIFCAGVLEFAEDIHKFLRSLRSMATDNAEMVLIAPLKGIFGSVYVSYLKKRGIPARVYTARSLVADLKAVGFESIEVRTAHPICLAIRARAIAGSSPGP